MQSLQKKINIIDTFPLSNLSLKQLNFIKEDLIHKINKLSTELDTLLLTIDSLESNDEDIRNLIPPSFSSPLRQVLTRNRDLKIIKEKYSRYNDELKYIERTIQEKTLNDGVVNIFNGNQWIANMKESVIMILIFFVLSLTVYQFSYTLTSDLIVKIFWIDFICCCIFLLNFFFELYLSNSKKWYWKTHWIDFITSIPIPDASILRLGRALRLVRVLRFLRFLRFFRILLLLFRGLESFKELLDIKLMKKTLSYSFILLIIGSISIVYFEKEPNGVANFMEGLWWSFSTLVVGGYADIHNPKTSGGMLITSILVVVGLVLTGVFIASLSSVIRDSEMDKKVQELKDIIDNRFNQVNKRLQKIENNK